MSNDTTETTDSLRLERCPECGYLLTGLPEQGICPECGSGFDRTKTVVLYGWLGSYKGQFSATGVWVRVPLAIALMIGLQMLARVLPFRVNPGLLNFVAAMLVALYVWTYYKHRLARDELSAPVQLRLSAAGVGYRIGYGACPLHPWTPSMRVIIKPRWRGYWRLQMLHAGQRSVLSRRLRFRFKCDAETAKRLAERIEAWRGESRRAGEPNSNSSG